jgi:outer membrane protein assembly factor BamB
MAGGLLLVLPTVGRGDDWPQWRGPEGNGAWNEKGVLHSFPADGLKVSWRATVGPGYSSPVVANGRVYITYARMNPPKATECVDCLDEATGKVLWSFCYPADYPEYAFKPPPGMGPTATPVVRVGKVYALGSMGHLHCLDAASGKVVWEKRLDQEYGAKEFNCNSSPVVEGKLVILFVGVKPGASVVALDKDSGKEVWKALDDQSTNSTPTVMTHDGTRQVVVWTQQSVSALEASTGRLVWRFPLETTRDVAIPTPVAHENLLLVGGLMLELGSGRSGARVLWPQVRPVQRRILSVTSTGMIRDGCVYSARLTGALVCLDAKTGKQIWETDKVTGTGNGSSIHLTPNAEDVFLYTDRGDLIVAKLSAQGYREISRAHLIDPTTPYSGRNVIWPPPAYANRHVFVRSDRELVCASLEAKP